MSLLQIASAALICPILLLIPVYAIGHHRYGRPE